MNNYLIVPVVSTLAGGMIAYLLRTSIIRHMPYLLQKFLQASGPYLFAPCGLLAAIAGKSNFQNIQPVIEGHIDEFLRHRLGKEMPMIGLFVGEKTITQLKAIFMKELEDIFPLVMDKYISNLSSGFNPQAFISQKISSLSNEKIKSLCHSAAPQLRMIPIWGAITGLAVGILQLIAIRIVSTF